MSRRRSAALVAALALTAAAAGVATGLAAERRVVRSRRTGPDPEATEPFGRLPADRVLTVTADDGVELHVEEVGPPDAPVTVVFHHGLANSLGCWHYQRRDLFPPGTSMRAVFYDARGHGRSGRGSPERSTLEQLAEDLLLVLERCVPRGPVVLVGHSLGGMAVQEFLAMRPDRWDGRVSGVVLVATSAGKLADVLLGPPAALGRGLGIVLDRRVVESPAAHRAATAVDVARSRGSDLSVALTRRFAFGSNEVSPSLVEYVQREIGSTPTDVVLEFAPALLAHDRIEVLRELSGLPLLVMCGENDLLTPLDHSASIAEAVGAEVVPIPGAGHMAHMERPAYVSLRIQAFLRELADGRADGGRTRSLVLDMADDCRALGEAVGRLARAGDLIVLSGPLGAGKTVLAQGVARGLGVTGEVTSPTFVIARTHLGGRVPLVHVDAYRLGGIAELDDLDLDTDLDDSVLVVEWGEGLVEQLSQERLEIRLDPDPTAVPRGPAIPEADGPRRATLVPVGAMWARRLATLPLVP